MSPRGHPSGEHRGARPEGTTPGASAPGPSEAFARLAGGVASALSHRLELAGIELGEARVRLVTGLIASIASLLLLLCAVLLLSSWLAVSLWDTMGAAVLGWLALAYAIAGFAVLGWLRGRLRSSPPLLALTIAELRSDAAAMRGGAAASEPAREA